MSKFVLSNLRDGLAGAGRLLIGLSLAVTSVLALPVVARADTQPAPGVPQTVGTDPLPTAQIDGVVWAQAVVGNQVFVGGDFSKARPAGVSAGGAGEVDRTYLMSYDIRTGVMTNWAPVLNGQVRAIRVSPDGNTVYVSGQFTTVNGQARYRMAAFNAQTGALLANFRPTANATVTEMAVTGSTVYAVGTFTTMSGQDRDGVAAFNASDGSLLPWMPVLAGGNAAAVVVSPDGAKVVLGGQFTTVNGSSNPGYGLAMVDAVTGTNLPMPVNALVRNGQSTSGITDLEATADGFYGGGYTYSRASGNLEGMFRADWNGNLVWVEDCHGDTYGIYPSSHGAVYTAGHSHYCGNVGGFPQTTPWTYYRGLAFSDDVRGKVANENLGYYNFYGQSRPDLLTFFPNINAGTFTGLSQGPWDVTGNSEYVVYGGEFTRVNAAYQQGLVRFALRSTKVSTDRPVLDTGTQLRTLPMADGRARLSMTAAYDRDNALLTYRIYRDNVVISEQQLSSSRWNLPRLSYVDSGLVPGQTYSYKVRVSDPDGNVSWTQPQSYTHSAGAALTGYDLQVLSDNPMGYWGLNETSGAAADTAEGQNGTVGSLVTRGVPGAIAGSSTTAYRFNSTSSSTTSTVIPQTASTSQNEFSIEAWFKTTNTRGGGIVNFGGAKSGNSGTAAIDRTLYVGSDGKLYFGVNPATQRTVNSPASVRDGQWHHAVATLDGSGMKLYLDGTLVGSRTDYTTGRNFDGVWRIGGDRHTGWPANPSAGYLNGDIDQVAVYPYALGADRVAAHRAMGVNGALPNQLPTASFEATPQFSKASVNAAASNDPDGTITSYDWNFGDGATATGVEAEHVYTTDGTFTVTLTVTDDRGGQATTTRQVTVANGVPTAAFNVTKDGLGISVDAADSTDPDGTIASYAWDFGDGGTATGATASHSYTNPGNYQVKLTVTDNRGATATTTKTVGVTANQAPTASFSKVVTNLKVTFDASDSADPDGTVASYAWDFGDGSNGTGQKPSHTYATADTFTVKLIVTDDKGAQSAPVTAQVTTTQPANVKPQAAFSSSSSGLTASFDGSGSSDSDGTIASYAWDFGDGDNGTGQSPNHGYAGPGSYLAKLTVTDDAGATDSVSKWVTVGSNKVVQDDFNRSVTRWGNADLGGAYTYSNGGVFSTNGSKGVVKFTTAGTTGVASLAGVSVRDQNVFANLSLDGTLTGSGVYSTFSLRKNGTSEYSVKVQVYGDRSLRLGIVRKDNGVSSSLGDVTVSGLSYSDGDTLNMRVTAVGNGTTTVTAKVWKAGTAEPGTAQLSRTDSTASLQVAGSFALSSYLGSSATSVPVEAQYDNLLVTQP